MGFSKFETLYSRRDPSDNIIPIQKDATVSSGLECKSKQREEIYVRSDGEVFPCPYQGHRKNFSGLNLHTQTLEEIIFNEYFDKFSFDNPICDFNCNKKIRNQRIREVITTDRD
jgi:MoaA/NifB/PqqE/SkfB family radical SAM enzyme